MSKNHHTYGIHEDSNTVLTLLSRRNVHVFKNTLTQTGDAGR